MQRNTAQIIAAPFTFADMQSGPNGQTQTIQSLSYRLCALNSSRRTSEGQNEAVTRRVDLLTSKIVQLPPYDKVVLLQKVPPFQVSHCCSFFRRANKIRY